MAPKWCNTNSPVFQWKCPLQECVRRGAFARECRYSHAPTHPPLLFSPPQPTRCPRTAAVHSLARLSCCYRYARHVTVFHMSPALLHYPQQPPTAAVEQSVMFSQAARPSAAELSASPNWCVLLNHFNSLSSRLRLRWRLRGPAIAAAAVRLSAAGCASAAAAAGGSLERTSPSCWRRCLGLHQHHHTSRTDGELR